MQTEGAAGTVSSDRYQDFVFAPGALAEEADLPLELKKEILYLHAHLGTFDHWRVLGVPWNAPVEAVRAAYVAKVKLFHPDRHAGRRLGSYLPRIEAVFQALTAARDLLGDEAKRAEYARRTAPPEEIARMEARRLEDEARSGERRARLTRTNPMLARVARVQELLERGKRALADGRYAQAATDFATAAGLDPRHPEARALSAEARRRQDAHRAAELYDEGTRADAIGDTGRALDLLRRAATLDGENASYAVAAARLALAAGQVTEARSLAEQGARLAPRDARALEVLGTVLHAAGDAKGARRALERALDLEPALASAKALLRKLRWSFLR